MKTAYIFSGGGAKIGFEAGAYDYIRREVIPRFPDFEPASIDGVSCGALAGAMIASGKIDALMNILTNLTNDQIYTGLDVQSVIKKAIAESSILEGWIRMKGIMENEPLKRLIAEHVTLDGITCPTGVGVTSLETGQYMNVKAGQCLTDREWQEWVLASTVMPVIWAPVLSQPLNGVFFNDLVDGGLRQISPVGDVIDNDPDQVVIINCSNSTERPMAPQSMENVIDIAERVLSILLMDNFDNDVQTFLRINDLVRQAGKQGAVLMKSSGEPYHEFKAFLIEPQNDIGGSLDFTNETMKMAHGREVARSVFAEMIETKG